jgi:hypothetical protein
MPELHESAALAERNTAAQVEVLVDSQHPDRRAYTIEGIDLPDFNLLRNAPKDRAGFYTGILVRDEHGELVCRSEEGPVNDIEQAAADTVENWLTQSIEAAAMGPVEGSHYYIANTYFYGNKDNGVFREGIPWHYDDAWAFTYFTSLPTEVWDADSQDAYKESYDEKGILTRKYGGMSDEEVKNILGDNPRDHINYAKDGQTLALACKAVHRVPSLRADDVREGIVAFVYPAIPDPTQEAK